MSTRGCADRGIRRWLVVLMFLSLLGAADSRYLLAKHRNEGSAFCPSHGCDVVNQGEYAAIGGIPLAALGLGVYLMLLLLSIMAATVSGRSAVGAIFAISGVGVAVSAFLVYLQVAVIGAICSWCVLSAFTMASIFILSMVLLRKMRPLQQSGLAGQLRVL